MHDDIIPTYGENTSSFTLSLKESYDTSFDLILEHEWTLDLLNFKLTVPRFEGLIEQQALLYDDLARRTMLFALKEPQYEILKKPANFLINESFTYLKLLKTHLRAINPFAVMDYYLEIISQAWDEAPLIHKLITLIIPLWLRQDLKQQFLVENSYNKPNQEWIDQVINHNPDEAIQTLSSLIDLEAKNLNSDEEFMLHPLLLKLLQSELLIRNEAYQLSHQQLNQLDRNS